MIGHSNLQSSRLLSFFLYDDDDRDDDNYYVNTLLFSLFKMIKVVELLFFLTFPQCYLPPNAVSKKRIQMTGGHVGSQKRYNGPIERHLRL